MAGNRVKMSPAVLRRECLGSTRPEDAILVMSFVRDELVGQAFVVKWRYGASGKDWELSMPSL